MRIFVAEADHRELAHDRCSGGGTQLGTHWWLERERVQAKLKVLLFDVCAGWELVAIKIVDGSLRGGYCDLRGGCCHLKGGRYHLRGGCCSWMASWPKEEGQKKKKKKNAAKKGTRLAQEPDTLLCSGGKRSSGET